jgi:hypothetical protein
MNFNVFKFPISKLQSFQSRSPLSRPFSRTLLAFIGTGAFLYQFTIGKTTNTGPLPFENDLFKTSLRHSPILAKLNPHNHVLQSDKQVIQIRRSDVPVIHNENTGVLTKVIHGVFHGYAFLPQRLLLTYFHPPDMSSDVSEKTRIEKGRQLQSSSSFTLDVNGSSSTGTGSILDQPETSIPQGGEEIWDLHPVKDVSSLKIGTSLLAHFWVVENGAPSSITFLFGDPSASSKLAGLFRVSVDEGPGRNSDKIEISITTVMYNPNEDKKAFSSLMWALHIVYSRLLLQNATMWVD